MSRRIFTATLVLTTLAAAGTTQAELFKKISRDFRRNNCWPAPFVYTDRAAVRAPFGMMIANGWRIQNTLSDQHFDLDSGVLNEAGELKVRDIVTEAPAEFRVVFVLRSTDPLTTAERLKSTEEAVQRFALPGETPQVAETSTRPRGASADYIDATGRKFRESTPEPRLPGKTGD